MAKRKIFTINKNLSAGITQTMSAVKNYAGELHFEIIALNQIELDPDNPRDLLLNFADLPDGPQQTDPNFARKIQEINSLNSLAETIAKQGVLNPVVVYKLGTQYRLIAGERRCLASVIAGKSDIKANVLAEKPSPYRRSLLQWIENIEREDLRLWERLQNIKQILATYTQETNDETLVISPSLLKSILGCSLPQAMNYHAVLNSDKVLQNAIENNDIKNLEKAAIISKIADESHRSYALEQAITGMSLKQLQQIVHNNNKKRIEVNKELAKINLVQQRNKKNKRVILGATREPLVVQTLVESILEQDSFKHYRSKFAKVNWQNHAAATIAFKELLEIMESVLSSSKVITYEL